MSASTAPKSRADKPWQSLTAGLVAGAVEGFVTYPAEMLKTTCQFSARAPGSGLVPVSPLDVIKTTFKRSGVSGFYSGCSALVVGNSAKAGVRFLSYDSIKNALVDSEVSTFPCNEIRAKKTDDKVN